LADAEEKERVLQLYSFKMVDEAENIKNNTQKGRCYRTECSFDDTMIHKNVVLSCAHQLPVRLDSVNQVCVCRGVRSEN